MGGGKGGENDLTHPLSQIPGYATVPQRFHKAQQGIGRHIKTTVTQAFLSEIVIKNTQK